MNSKIVILDDSVILYQHYIGDEKWESVMAFPRGGLTYLIKNNNIKFFAYVDYFYKNCIMTMNLPIYLVDNKYGIDGEYSDIEEITEILNKIFPENISGSGSPITVDAYTKEQSDARYQPIGDYVTEPLYLKTINGESLSGTGNIVIDGGSIDAYTKEQSDERYQPKGDYVLSGTLIQHITNLQQQIDSILETISGCCSSSGETIYRWVTMVGENDYICSGTTKYTKEKKQQSTDNGITWTDVSPEEYKIGVVLEEQSSDCGYQPTIEYRWVDVSGGYVCSGTTKYNQEKQQYRIDGGTWIDTDPLQTRRGSTILEEQSIDCGYHPVTEHKLSVTYNDSSVINVNCDGNPELLNQNFSNWQNITSATVGDCITIIGNQAFNGFSGMTSISIPSGVTSIGKLAFSHNIALPSITLPSALTSIGNQIFNYCLSLETIDIPSGVTIIPYDAFFYCSGLTNVTMTNVEKIGVDAFGHCSFATITLPYTLTEVGEYAFAFNNELTDVTINAITPPAFKDINGEDGSVLKNIFFGCSNLTNIYVPAESVEAYKASNGWSTYANIIQAKN